MLHEAAKGGDARARAEHYHWYSVSGLGESEGNVAGRFQGDLQRVAGSERREVCGCDTGELAVAREGRLGEDGICDCAVLVGNLLKVGRGRRA